MAKATKTEVETVVKVGGIVLELGMDEVNALRAVFTAIGGPPSGPRGKIDSITKAIEAALGVGPYEWDAFEDREKKGMRGHITFEDYPSE